jgi:ornithine carbamoyltransferase
MKQDLISILDIKDSIEEIIDRAIEFKTTHQKHQNLLTDTILAMIFEKSSTRTRVSFEVGMKKLGGDAIFLGKNDIQLGRGETLEDTALVLSRYVDIIVYRAFKHQDMIELARHATVPVINGLDDQEHPCQVLADFMTIKEQKQTLSGLSLVYYGDGSNNMAHSYMLGCAAVGMHLKIVAPRAYWPSDQYVRKAKDLGGSLEIVDETAMTSAGADVIATDTWISMGDEATKQQRLAEFKGYTIDSQVMRQAKPAAIFLHCLPAYYDLEVTRDVAHGPQSVIFDEAENRLWAQMAIMAALLGV